MKKDNLNIGQLYQIRHPKKVKKFIYAVLVRLHKSQPTALMLPVYQFTRNKQQFTIQSPVMQAKKLESEFIFIPIQSIIKTIYFQGQPITLGQKDFNFVCVEALYYSVGQLNLSMNQYMGKMVGDELAEDTAQDFSLTAMHVLDLLQERFHPVNKQPSKQLEIFQYGIYRVHLIGDIGSEKTGSIDVLVWQKYVNHHDINKSTFYCFPITYKEPNEKDENRIPVQINQKNAWINVAHGRRISFLRFDHPVYDIVQKRPTFVLDKNDIHDINVAFLSHYSRN